MKSRIDTSHDRLHKRAKSKKLTSPTKQSSLSLPLWIASLRSQ
jgi:hypothetical protein